MESTEYCASNSQPNLITTSFNACESDSKNQRAACEVSSNDSSPPSSCDQKPNCYSSVGANSDAITSSCDANFEKGLNADGLELQFVQHPIHVHPELLQQLVFQTSPETQATSDATGHTPFNSRELHHHHICLDQSGTQMGGITRFIVPFEATINPDFPHSVLLTPCKSSGTYGIPIQPFVLSTGLKNLPQYSSDSNYVDDIPHGTTMEATPDPQCSPQLALNEKNEILNEMAKRPHPGFILLSIRHEKRGDNSRSSSDCHVFPPNIKINSVASRKFSRQRSRKPTPAGANCENAFGKKFEVTTVENEHNAQLDQKQPHSSRSRFRVTRIADSSSWWIPDHTSMVICVHDLKTSMIPDFVRFQAQKLSSLQLTTEYSYDEMKRTFWNCLEPKYLQT